MAKGNHKRIRGKPQIHSLLEHYQPIDGVVDEMVDASGNPRPVWKDFIEALDELGPETLGQRFARADQYLRDAGVYYRVYDKAGANEREWPLAHVPLLIEDKEWADISAGLVQRAELFEETIADIYGPNRLVEKGILPAGLIAASPEYLRPVVGTVPASGHFLHFCAFELGRGPDGQWWVLGDRTQAPSGAGFALENRVATTRALSDIYGEMHVHRLAGFFRRFRDALIGMAEETDGRVAILTPGPLNETYYEHAYIARYLGIMLLEGEDLTVSGGRLMVRTVSGLMPISVLWRRLDAAFADPLELRSDSQIGTPGLVEAIRQGAVSTVNALGSGLMETRALLAFLPKISRALRGEELLLPSVATWWCGQDTERAHVLANIDRMVIGPALSTRLAFEDDDQTKLGSALSAGERAELAARIERDGGDFVGQEAVTLSTTPVFVGGWLEPRPASLRVYLARTPAGWTVMPGGFARVGLSLDPTAIAMQRGGQAADVWVVSDRPVERETLLPQESDSFTRTRPGSLPSRAAENLTWLGRYIERSEDTVRILRAYHVRLAETSDPDMPLLADIRDYLEPFGVDVETAIPPGLIGTLDSAVYSAGQIRDRFSPDGWLALKDLSKTIHQFAKTVAPGDDATRAMTVILRKLAGFSGLLHENMYRFAGWRFLEIGRRLERGIQIARTLSRLTSAKAPDGALDMMLEIGDSVMTHRRQYPVQTGRRTVIDLLALDPLNPRSILFQLERLKAEIGLLPSVGGEGHMSPAAKEILQLNTQIAIKEPSDMTAKALDDLAHEIGGLYNSLAKAYFG
ncbi:circularly permuted type 2 ATP-grasp protein [Mesorhizobium qingshengii]|uniref:Circularly permuted type 2 ATP-grasp protein n=1 Tax=Mesorhizobium qingshengii TaxID=1165689 RepID=A0ABT4QSH6_9HYPH|nr:circularly permuted type 2 ATP-grasp protein [Mesorhizobium qingshengii]MCZ8544488.1 circularly permuted type 2 ATP-grasp protein [Mesorhizobium qingshengii]